MKNETPEKNLIFPVFEKAFFGIIPAAIPHGILGRSILR